METRALLISAKVIPERTDKKTGELKQPIGLIEVAAGDSLDESVTQVWLDAASTQRVMRLAKFDEVVVEYEVRTYNGQPQLRAVAVKTAGVTA